MDWRVFVHRPTSYKTGNDARRRKRRRGMRRMKRKRRRRIRSWKRKRRR
jgi:hypothetical protein